MYILVFPATITTIYLNAGNFRWKNFRFFCCKTILYLQAYSFVGKTLFNPFKKVFVFRFSSWKMQLLQFSEISKNDLFLEFTKSTHNFFQKIFRINKGCVYTFWTPLWSRLATFVGWTKFENTWKIFLKFPKFEEFLLKQYYFDSLDFSCYSTSYQLSRVE